MYFKRIIIETVLFLLTIMVPIVGIFYPIYTIKNSKVLKLKSVISAKIIVFLLILFVVFNPFNLNFNSTISGFLVGILLMLVILVFFIRKSANIDPQKNKILDTVRILLFIDFIILLANGTAYQLHTVILMVLLFWLIFTGIEILYFLLKKINLSGMNRMVISIYILSIISLFLYMLNKELITVFLTKLQVAYMQSGKFSSPIERQLLENTISLIKQNFLYIIFIYVVVLNLVVYIFVEWKAKAFKRLSYWFLVIYMLIFLMEFVFKIHINNYLNAYMELTEVIYAVYACKILYARMMSGKVFPKYVIIVFIILFYFTIFKIMFIIGALESLGLFKYIGELLTRRKT